jgi:hypothetical protein
LIRTERSLTTNIEKCSKMSDQEGSTTATE